MTSSPPPATSGPPEGQAKQAKEPDATPVRPEHVVELLRWLGPRMRYTDIHTHTLHLTVWTSALKGNLTLGLMRRGMRLCSGVPRVPMMTGVQFWHLCNGNTSIAEIEKQNERPKRSKGE